MRADLKAGIMVKMRAQKGSKAIPKPDDVFRIHPGIRWAGLADDRGQVVFSQMRPGVESLSPVQTDRAFTQIGPLVLTEVCERLTRYAGPVGFILIDYGKVTMLVMKLADSYLALTVGKTEPLDTLLQIRNQIQTSGPISESTQESIEDCDSEGMYYCSRARSTATQIPSGTF
jgi:hypothetical protein